MTLVIKKNQGKILDLVLQPSKAKKEIKTLVEDCVHTRVNEEVARFANILRLRSN